MGADTRSVIAWIDRTKVRHVAGRDRDQFPGVAVAHYDAPLIVDVGCITEDLLLAWQFDAHAATYRVAAFAVSIRELLGVPVRVSPRVDLRTDSTQYRP